MKSIRFLPVMLLMAFSVDAQNCATKNTDAAAKKVLDGVSAKFKTFKTVSGKFTLKSENAAGKTLSSKSGQVYLKGNKYRVSITGQEIFCDGATTWTYDKLANEVTVTKTDPTSTSISPQKMFTNFYDKDFLYKLNGEKTEGGKVMQEIEMTPCDKTKPYHKVYVYVDKTGSTISKTKVLEKSNNKYTCTVNSLTPNAAVSDATFSFDKAKYPGVEVVDLR
jgi:outer membrane lipoprotein carrier protein